MSSVPVSEPAMEAWRNSAGGGWKPEIEHGHAKVENALILDPYALSGLDDLAVGVRTALMAPFHVKGEGAVAWAGPKAAIDKWGAVPGSFTRRNSEVRRKPVRDEWDRMYQPVFERSLAVSGGPKGESADSLRLQRAPSIRVDGVIASRQNRTVGLLKTEKVPHVMLPMSLIDPQDGVRRLSIEHIRLLMALYAMSDITMYGGVDPNHACVLDGALTMSDEYAYRLSVQPPELFDSLIGPLSPFFAFAPASLAVRSIFPSARDHVIYMGPNAKPECRDFVIRPLRWPKRKDVTA